MPKSKVNKKSMSKVKSTKKKFEEETYDKMTHHEHILELPDTYIGSIESDKGTMWVYDEVANKITKKEIEYVPGLYKIYDEILVNARDHSVRDKKCRNIKVDINENTISVYNDGAGIPVHIQEGEEIYVPEMIFGNLLTSSNYKQKGKIVGGKNGYGAKLANIYSTKFIIETVDGNRNKKYYQEFSNNMYKIEKPIITDVDKKTKAYTKIIFTPDFKRFGMEDGFTQDIISLFKKRVYDIAACTTTRVKVYLNNEKLNVDTFESYARMFYNSDFLDSEDENSVSPFVYDSFGDRWRLGVVYDPSSGFDQISYVNGICTFKGGLHIDHVMNQLINGLQNHIKKKNKKLNVRNSIIRDNLTIFLDCVIEDPSFGSQTKEQLTSKVATFGSRCEITEDFIKKLSKTGIVDMVLEFAKLKELSTLSKSDGKKRTTLRGIDKLEDAQWAGSRKSEQCRLILTEGDSAKNFAMSGREIIGIERFGVFPLRGKLLNVRDTTSSKLVNNEEIKNIKQIMGLKQGMNYTDTKQLRYGGIVILCDADVDGSHIKGLIINFLHYFWPSLLKIKGFVQSMCTPIVKAWKKTDTKKKNVKIFYTMTEFQNWIENDLKGDLSKWETKYYKGLGTSTEVEAMDAFNQFDKRLINYIWEQQNKLPVDSESSEESKEESESNEELKENVSPNSEEEREIRQHPSSQAINLAFSKLFINNRKTWLGNYNKDNIIENDVTEVTYSDFINRDLIHFSNYDLVRSIPSLCDGFKPSQRKIIYVCFLKNLLKKEMKVSQLAGYVSAETEYHHGEASLQGAIINMAQNFTGSNNLNLLNPNGQFGNRRMGGKNSASARYIFTQLNELTPKIFRKEDTVTYKYNVEDGQEYEPITYAPIIPTVLINGPQGIGTGFSTKIPCYNPVDIAKNLVKMLSGKEPTQMTPWYRGFKGSIKQDAKKQYVFKTRGKYEIINSTTIRITELPIGVWTDDYRRMLDSMINEDPRKIKSNTKIIADYVNRSGNSSIDFTVTFIRGVLQKLQKSNTIEKVLKLQTNVNTSNMHLYNKNGNIKKYQSTTDILKEYYSYRLDVYKERKEQIMKVITHDMNVLKYRAMFVEYVAVKRKIDVRKISREKLINKLQECKFPELSISYGGNPSYDYLIGMPIYSLTLEKIEELNGKLDEKLKELENYKNTSCETMWKEELEEFVTAYKKWMKDLDMLEAEMDKKKMKNKVKKVRRKR